MKETIFKSVHEQLGAKMVEFAGFICLYNMKVCRLNIIM